MNVPLKTDFKNEILPDNMTHRGYNIMSESDDVLFNNVHLEKSYIPLQEGDEYGEDEINLLNKTVNQNITDIETLNSDLAETNQTVSSNYTTLDGKINETNGNVTTLTETVTNNYNELNNNKVQKETGKGLSTNDFTNEYKQMVEAAGGDFTEIEKKITALDTNKADKSAVEQSFLNINTQLNKKGNIDGFEKKNLTISASLWVSDTTFPDFPFKASISISGLTDNHICTAFTPDHLNRDLDGIFSPWSNVRSGYLDIFANVQPASFIAELLRFEKVVV